jgi:probable DNA metabolism protein
VIQVRFPPSLAGWRAAARPHLAARTPAELLQWESSASPQQSLDLGDDTGAGPPAGDIRVPAAFIKLAAPVALHRDPSRWGDLYTVALRLVADEAHLLEIESDPAVLRLNRMAQQVRRDIHKMHAFVRFRRITIDGVERFVAWHRPDHYIVPAAARFFVERFASMQWSIITPDACAHWDGSRLRFAPGVDAPPAVDDPTEAVWRAYYGAIFNPARLNLRAMRAEMPTRHWKTLPEAAMLPALITQASPRVACMLQERDPGLTRAAPPATADLEQLRSAALTCTSCELHTRATQVVFGAGARTARIMLVGEQPGDQEDLAGMPFVGPAGQVLDRVLARVGIAREQLYVTNVVKHFKWEPRGKRRIHMKPRLSEIRACRPWLDAELAAVSPRVIVCLGATAATALLGPQFRLSKELGRVHASPWTASLIATYHPSAVLRAEDPAHAKEIEEQMAVDLRRAGELADQ